MSRRCDKGFTLIELLVSIAVFTIVIVLMYPTFSFINEQSEKVSDREALHERGQRILSYISRDLSTAGFVVGSTTPIPYCSSNDVSVIQHNDGVPYDTITFITSKPVEIKLQSGCIIPEATGCTNSDYYLNVCDDAQAGAIQLSVDAPLSCVEGLSATTNVSENGRSIIAFERASQIKSIYKVSSYLLKTITLETQPPFSSLELSVPQNSIVYGVRQYRYEVDTTTRTLRRVGWKQDCSTDPIEIDGAFGENGGLDAIQFQYIYNDSISGTQITSNTLPAEIKDLRAIRVIILVRSEGPDRNYTDNNSYDLDGTLQTPLQFNDRYRRVVLSKTVEVKSIAF